MKNGILFCVGIALYFVESYCWYQSGKDDTFGLMSLTLLVLLRIMSTILVVLPILDEFM